MESYTERVYMEVLRWRVVRDPLRATYHPQTAPQDEPHLTIHMYRELYWKGTWWCSDGGWLVTLRLDLRDPGCVYSPTNSTSKWASNTILIYGELPVSVNIPCTWWCSDGGWLVTLRNPGCVYSPTNSTQDEPHLTIQMYRELYWKGTWWCSDGGWLVTLRLDLRNPGCVYSPTNST